MGVQSDQITQPYQQELPGSQGYNRLLGGNLGAGGQAQNASPPAAQGNPQTGPLQQPNTPLRSINKSGAPFNWASLGNMFSQFNPNGSRPGKF